MKYIKLTISLIYIMKNKLISKIKAHFGNESLIMYSKCCDYYKINPIKKEDIQMYYKFLLSDQSNNQNKINDISCCLYYLSNNNKKYQNIFTSQIIEKLDINNDLINKDNLVLIYNIIEFDELYLKSDRIKIQYLLYYLERFSKFYKSNTKCLLYKYYRGCLKLQLGDLDSANAEYLENIVFYDDEIVAAKKENKYTLFIRLQNDLLNERITKQIERDDIKPTINYVKGINYKNKNINQLNNLQVDNNSNSNIKSSDIWVKKWVDESSKFGLGYLLNNGIFGVIFNDNSKIVLNPKINELIYIDINPQDKKEVISKYNVEDYPIKLDKKIILLQCCISFLEIIDNDDIDNDNDNDNDKEKYNQKEKREFNNNEKQINKKPFTFVTEWMRLPDAIIFRLSNKYEQVCFNDKTEIILSFETKVVTYVNGKKERLTYLLNKAYEETNIEMINKLKYTEYILKEVYAPNIKEIKEHEKQNVKIKNIPKIEENLQEVKINNKHIENLEKIKNLNKKDEYAHIEEMEKMKNKNDIDIKEQERQILLVNNNHNENLEIIKNYNKKDEYVHIEEMEKIKNKNEIDNKEMDMKLIGQENTHKENMLKLNNEFEEKKLEYDIKAQQINSENEKFQLENKKIEFDYKKSIQEIQLNEMKIKNSFLLNEKQIDNNYKINEKELDNKYEIGKMRIENEYKLNILREENFKLILEKIPADKLIELYKPQIINYFSQVNQTNYFINPQHYQNYQNSMPKNEQKDLNLNNENLNAKIEKDKSIDKNKNNK